MKKELIKKIEIPEGVKVELNGKKMSISFEDRKNIREFDLRNLEININDKEIILSEKRASKKDKRIMNTIAAHIKNMIKGVLNPYEYKLKICFNHFPINVEIKGKEAIIKNFLGERSARKLKIIEGANVKVDKEIITVTSPDKEIAGQVAANFENITRIPNRDRRVFQDGIFIINKHGKEI